MRVWVMAAAAVVAMAAPATADQASEKAADDSVELVHVRSTDCRPDIPCELFCAGDRSGVETYRFTSTECYVGAGAKPLRDKVSITLTVEDGKRISKWSVERAGRLQMTIGRKTVAYDLLGWRTDGGILDSYTPLMGSRSSDRGKTFSLVVNTAVYR